MPTFRYAQEGHWYKGNTHIHSTASDGGKNFGELAQQYARAGYHFLFRTDHWVASDVSADPQDYPLLWLDGVELDGCDETGALFHIVALGSFQGLQREMGLQSALAAVREQNGLLILAHPRWTGNSFADAVRWNLDGVEVYNHVCQWLNAKGEGGAYWSAMLDHAPNTLAFAADDAHLHAEEPGWNGGWIMVNAAECSREAILAALRAGNFYSSRGPEFHSIRLDGQSITIDCSPVQFAWLVGPAYRGQRVTAPPDSPLTHVSFKIPRDWPYSYIEIEDAQGRRAWTNPLFARE